MGPPSRERARAALCPRTVVPLAFLPPIARVDSRLPRAPTCDLPSRSCWPVSPFASLCLLLDRLRLFSALLAYFDAPDSLSAMEKLSYSVPSESAALVSVPRMVLCDQAPSHLNCMCACVSGHSPIVSQTEWRPKPTLARRAQAASALDLALIEIVVTAMLVRDTQRRFLFFWRRLKLRTLDPR